MCQHVTLEVVAAPVRPIAVVTDEVLLHLQRVVFHDHGRHNGLPKYHRFINDLNIGKPSEAPSSFSV